MTQSIDEALQGMRAQIDAIDEELLSLLNRRARCAERVGEIKASAFGLAQSRYRAEREAQVLRRVQEMNPGPLPNETIALIFRETMSACLALEKPLSISFLGPWGTFSESAARKQFGHAAQLLPEDSIDATFRAVEAEQADYAIVPIENSTEGAIGRTLDLLMSTPLNICGEVTLRVHQHLLSRSTVFGEIHKVYSHAQSLAQCQGWLSRVLPHAERIPVGSNAQAAMRALEEPQSAAIAGEAAAKHYALPILAENIEDEPNNTTRFVVVGRDTLEASGRDKTSIIMSTQNQAGALSYVISALAEHGVSMTRLESRPARHTLWQYVFYADLEGHRTDSHVHSALSELKHRSAYLKILGSYPVAAY